MLHRLLTLVLVAASLSATPAEPAYQVLVFSKTAGFRHDSIPAGLRAIGELGAAHGFSVTATEDAAAFTDLGRYDAVVFLSTTGDVLDAAQQAAFERYIDGGGGYVGVHSAADTEYDWPYYGRLVGAYFKNHPAIQQATVRTEDRAHPATAHLGQTWTRTDEWYNYRANPRADVHVLQNLDESSYTGGDMGDHPITWCRTQGKGRSFYTGLGHTNESYADPAFRDVLLGGIRYAAGAAQADCRPENGYTALYDGSLAGWSQAGPGGFTEQDATLTSQGGLGLLWYRAEEFASYSLKLDWRVTGDGNSGVFVGFPASDDPWSAVNNGYEVQIDATDAPDRTTGSVYGFKAADLAARDAALNPPGQWNTYELLVEDERLRVFLNGVRINDFTNTDPRRSLRQGHVGIQNHGPTDQVSFRDIRIRRLGATVEAESCTSGRGVRVVRDPRAGGGKVLGHLDDGDWAGYANVTTRDAASFSARVSAGRGGTIQIRSGSRTGPLLGSVAVPARGGFRTVTTPLTGTGTGPLHLVFKGGRGHLFDVDALTLVRR
ncbi:Type 1 glutamine amidotransferase (GATase1) [Nonomuraea solani]|uniref:Type 1 glutamine amidotransferase (GATase1) n=1 Tax=Nonomuraea solani TaxID=1144553 RepID=A0A1H6E2X6_9ACTN|nr:ThuA domain-containing protein [Nonomuraea solani]SEG91980.1 Type 1 glutamine amidotransferase (GATase1) [Nonomuraea solani]